MSKNLVKAPAEATQEQILAKTSAFRFETLLLSNMAFANRRCQK
jgi:hypothetical protein